MFNIYLPVCPSARLPVCYYLYIYLSTYLFYLLIFFVYPLLYVLYQGFIDSNHVPSFVRQMSAMSMSRLCRTSCRASPSLEMQFALYFRIQRFVLLLSISQTLSLRQKRHYFLHIVRLLAGFP